MYMSGTPFPTLLSFSPLLPESVRASGRSGVRWRHNQIFWHRLGSAAREGRCANLLLEPSPNTAINHENKMEGRSKRYKKIDFLGEGQV